MSSTEEWFPTLGSITELWRAVITGSVSREDAHAHAVRWIETSDGDSLNPVIWQGVARLHSFDLAYADSANASVIHHGPPGTYRQTAKELADDLTSWLGDVAEYQEDPVKWHSKRRDQLLKLRDAGQL